MSPCEPCFDSLLKLSCLRLENALRLEAAPKQAVPLRLEIISFAEPPREGVGEEGGGEEES